jgi:hypothetical protein
MPCKHWLVLVQVSGLAVLSGCGTNYDPLNFLNSVKQVTKNWTVDAGLFGKMIRVERDPARLQADHRDLIAKIKKLRAESTRIRVPSGKEAQELWNAFQTYLIHQENMVTGEFKELVSIRSDSSPDMDRFRTILGRCKETEDADLARLHQAEAAFETAHGIVTR